MKKVRLKALMTLSATDKRGEIERGTIFETDPQEARDLIADGRAQKAPAKVAK